MAKIQKQAVAKRNFVGDTSVSLARVKGLANMTLGNSHHSSITGCSGLQPGLRPDCHRYLDGLAERQWHSESLSQEAPPRVRANYPTSHISS